MTSRGRLLLGALLAIILLLLFFRGVAWSDLGRAFGRAHLGYLALVVLATLVTYALRAWRWGLLLQPLVEVPYGRLFSATYVGFMTGLLVPRAGEVVRPYLVARRHPVRTSAAFASIILERLFDLITVLAFFGLYFFVLPTPAAQREGTLLDTLKVGAAVVSVISAVVLGLLIAFHAHAERLLALADRVFRLLPGAVARPAREMLGSFGKGLAVLQAPIPHLLAIAGQSVLVWLAIAAGVYWNNRAFGIGLPFHAAFLILGFLTVGVAVPTPGMVGGFHESFLLALTQAYGVNKGVAAAAGITLHALNSLPVLILGLLLLGGEGLTLGRVAEMTEEGSAPEGGPP